jgi:hypothetical protein
MKVTPYQQNANLLREYQRVIHQKNVHELDRLNHQKECQKKYQREQWVRPNSVDVMV